MIQGIANARLPGQPRLHTLRFSEARIAAVIPQADRRPPDGNELDAGGELVVPSLVDAHLHLDLAYSVDVVPQNRSGTLREAIALWSRAKAELTAEDVRARALRAIDDEIAGGTGFIRSHVDVAGTAGLRLAEGVLEARDATRERCRIQLVAFPQDGLIRDPAAQRNLREAMQLGVDLVGGIPHVEHTPADGIRHLEFVFDAAAEFDADIDVHIDETDDPTSTFTEHLAALTIERHWQGRVTASHVCALASYDEAHAHRVMDLLAAARVNVVTNPGVNLHLQGRYDRFPQRRGLTRVRDLLARGVRCAAGQDCIRDPFYPLGNGRLLDQAFLLVHAAHMGSPDGIVQAFDMVCAMASDVVERGPARVEAGARADLAVFPAADLRDLLCRRPLPSAVLFEGRRADVAAEPAAACCPAGAR